MVSKIEGHVVAHGHPPVSEPSDPSVTNQGTRLGVASEDVDAILELVEKVERRLWASQAFLDV